MKEIEKTSTGYRPAHTCFTGDALLDAIVESSQGGGSEYRKDKRREQKFSGYEASVSELAHIHMNEKISVRRAQIEEDGSYPDMDSPKWKFICRDEVLSGDTDERTHSLIFSKIGAIVDIANVCVTYRVIYGKEREPMGTFFATFEAANRTCYTMARRFDMLKSYPQNPSIWVAEKTGQIFNMGPHSLKQGLPLTQYQKGLKSKRYNAITINDKDYMVHYLVADTWCQQTKKRWPKCDENTLVRNHIDENHLNNAAANLEFCSQGYNIRYSQLSKAARTNFPHLFSLPADYDVLEKYARGDVEDSSDEAFLAEIVRKHNKTKGMN